MITKINKTSEYIFDESQELNLLKMYRDTIKLSFIRHKGERIEFIASKLGISSKGIYRYCDMFNIRNLIIENNEYRKSFLKSK
jgi:hypothetical protein